MPLFWLWTFSCRRNAKVIAWGERSYKQFFIPFIRLQNQLYLGFNPVLLFESVVVVVVVVAVVVVVPGRFSLKRKIHINKITIIGRRNSLEETGLLCKWETIDMLTKGIYLYNKYIDPPLMWTALTNVHIVIHNVSVHIDFLNIYWRKGKTNHLSQFPGPQNYPTFRCTASLVYVSR